VESHSVLSEVNRRVFCQPLVSKNFNQSFSSTMAASSTSEFGVSVSLKSSRWSEGPYASI
jgi:hypothetical protein